MLINHEPAALILYRVMDSKRNVFILQIVYERDHAKYLNSTDLPISWIYSWERAAAKITDI